MQIHNYKISGSPLGVNPQCSRDPAHFPRVPQRTNYPLQSIPKVVLKKMLGHLTCIIFTYYRSTCGRCLECSHNYLQCKQLVSHLPPTHKRVFDYLTGCLCCDLYHDLYFPQHFCEKFSHTLPRMALTPRSWQLSSAISS